MIRPLVAVSLLAVCAAATVTTAQTQPPQARSGETYLWHGEVVSLDEGARTLTVKTRALNDVADQVERLSEGDRVLLKWSGHDTRAGAVRDVARYDPDQRITEFFAFPAELASRELQVEGPARTRYLTIRIPIPDTAAAEVQSVTPGQWVTVTTRQRPTGQADAIVAVRPYANPQPPL